VHAIAPLLLSAFVALAVCWRSWGTLLAVRTIVRADAAVPVRADLLIARIPGRVIGRQIVDLTILSPQRAPPAVLGSNSGPNVPRTEPGAGPTFLSRPTGLNSGPSPA